MLNHPGTEKIPWYRCRYAETAGVLCGDRPEKDPLYAGPEIANFIDFCPHPHQASHWRGICVSSQSILPELNSHCSLRASILI
jgi:hypothetical protein